MKRQLIVTLLTGLSLLGCSNHGYSNTNSGASDSASSNPTSPTTPTTPVTPPAPPTQQENYDSYMALPWEKAAASNRSWSTYIYSVIDNETTNLINGTSDVTNFCPNYASLSRQQKVEFWGYLFAEVSYYESGWDPLSRMAEDLGTDPITGKQVESEGLMQLSYQDVLNYPTCRISWAADKNLGSTDPRKTILDPDINLECGAIIMSKQITRKNAIVISSGAYWSTLMSGSRYNKIASIQKATKAISFCSN